MRSVIVNVNADPSNELLWLGRPRWTSDSRCVGPKGILFAATDVCRNGRKPRKTRLRRGSLLENVAVREKRNGLYE